jgi:hypothetical protein
MNGREIPVRRGAVRGLFCVCERRDIADFHADVGECLRVLRPAVISAASWALREG